MLAVICEGLLGADDHSDEWPVPYRHQISVTPDLPPKPSLFYSDRVKIAYLLIDPRVETSLSICGGGRARIPSIIISGPLVMRGLQ